MKTNKFLRQLSFILCLVLTLSLVFVAPAAGAESKFEPTVKVCFIDVGQGDSILIMAEKTVLVDAGPTSAANTVTEHLEYFDIEKIDYLVATHPHADHIGGMDEVIEAYDVGCVLAPNIDANSKEYYAFLDAAEANDVTIKTPKVITTYKLGEGIQLKVLAPAAEADSVNSNSIVLKLICEDVSFLLMGDAEKDEEKAMLSSAKVKELLPSTVLKVGHHGSTTSSSAAFVKAVSPKYSVISVGEDNSYNHPDNIILKRLELYGSKVYRTDKLGSLVFATDGSTLKITKLKLSADDAAPATSPKPTATPKPTPASTLTPTPTVQPVSGAYIGNASSHKFHKPTCRSLPDPTNRVYFSSREEAIMQGYSPCGICKP